MPLPKQYYPQDQYMLSSDDVRNDISKENQYIEKAKNLSNLIDKHKNQFIIVDESFLSYIDEQDKEMISFGWQVEIGRILLEVYIYSYINNKRSNEKKDLIRFLAKKPLSPKYFNEVEKIINKLELVKRNVKHNKV